MTEDFNESIERLRQLNRTQLVQDYYHHVSQTAGFILPPSIKELFDKHHRHFFNSPYPVFTADWGTNSPNWRWQKIHFESIIGSVQSAMAAVLYHKENLLKIERDVLAFPNIDKLVSMMERSCIGGGNTQKLDFEYHGFVFAFRRTLDYLARGIAALLRQDFNSFRRLSKILETNNKYNWVIKIIAIHNDYSPKLDSFLGDRTDNKSIRDKIAHYYHISAGSLNVNAAGIFFAGGGENIDQGRKLSIIINDYVEILRDIIDKCLQAIEEGFPKVVIEPLS